MSNRRNRFRPLPIHRRLQVASLHRRRAEERRRAALLARGREAVRIAREHAEAVSG